MQRQGEHAGIIRKNACRAVALVDIKVDHRDLQRLLCMAMQPRPLGLHQSGGHGAVVEDAKSAAFVRVSVVGAARQIGGNALGRCALTQAQRNPGCRHRCPC